MQTILLFFNKYKKKEQLLGIFSFYTKNLSEILNEKEN